MPGIFDTRDSIGSSKHYYTNPYRDDFDYRRAQQAGNDRNQSLDTLETTQQRVERELREKFLSQKGKIAPGSLIFLQQLSKFIFLAVMLPPYIAFYGMPKLVFKKVSTVAQKVAVPVAAYWNKTAKFCSFYLTKIYTWPVNKLHILSNKIKDACHQFALKIQQKLLRPVSSFIQSQTKKLMRLSEKIARPIKQFSLAAHNWIRKFSKIAEWIKIPSFNFTISKPKISFTKVAERLKSLKIKLQELARTVRKKAQEAFVFSMKLIEASWLFLWHPLSQFKLPQYQLPNFTTRIKEMYRNTLNAASRMAKPFIEAVAKMRSIVQKTTHKLSTFLQKMQDKVGKQAAKLMQFVTKKWSAVPKFKFSPFKKWSHLPGKAKEKWQQFTKKMQEKGRKIVEASTRNIGFAITASFAWLNRLLQMLGLFIKNFILSVRILYAVICLVIKFMIQSIKEKVSQELN